MVGLCSEVGALRAQVAAWRAGGARIALVPTMGALHPGHMSLVAAAKQAADRVVVTIFVNPKQFAPNEDFSAYPRDLDADRAAVAAVGADLVYAPALRTMYPAGFATTVSVEGPASAGLEDRFRPTHFAGVATIVAKLLIQAQSDVAVFGEKDYQQLKVIERLVADLDVPTEVRSAATMREADGLAMSSRNVYLSPEERARAPALYRSLSTCAATIGQGGAVAAALVAARRQLAEAGFAIDYVEARDGATLAPLADVAGVGRILAAARLGATRLIDNVAIAADRPLPSSRNTTR